MNSEDAIQHGTSFLSVAVLALQMALCALAYLALGTILWVGETIQAVSQKLTLRRRPFPYSRNAAYCTRPNMFQGRQSKDAGKPFESSVRNPAA